MFCNNCGKETYECAEINVHCGIRFAQKKKFTIDNTSHVVVL